MIRNLMEEHVAAAYESLRSHFPEFCGCEVCRADALVYTLNRVPPRYVASATGSAVTEVNLEKEQNRAPIEVTMMEAMRKIAAAPRCDGKGRVVRP